MRRLYKTLGLVALATLALAVSASHGAAHRAPASVLSLVSWGEAGAKVLRLSEGLVMRTSAGWRYVCPALWEADDITPAVALDGGPVVIGGYTGLFLLDGSGAVSRHPDPAAQGLVIGFAKVDATLFALLQANDLYAVVKVTADQVQTVWSDPSPWSSLAADANNLHVLRVDGTQVEHVQLSWQGALITRELVTTPELFVGVSGQMLQGQLYITGLSLSVLQLAQIDQGVWVSKCSAATNLTGPIEAGGQQFVTVDGVLTKFTTQCAPAVPTPEPVSCVGEEAGRAYSCTKGGASVLGPDGIGEDLFRLSDLGPPDLDKAPSCEVRAMCAAQWLRYQTDLVSTGMINAAVGIGDGGAGSTSGSGAACGDPFAIGGRSGAGGVALAGAGAADAGSGGSSPVPAATRRASSGCGIADAGMAAPFWFLLGLVPLLLRRVHTRPRRS